MNMNITYEYKNVYLYNDRNNVYGCAIQRTLITLIIDHLSTAYHTFTHRAHIV